ncbi:lytic transglycosylase domain-containing protein [Gemmobacter denitrificans]|uniref:Lytic transglycosylase domain-containing protein n=1 Tax=Gemmobacter denitrificans TaxID=3123040 RepID=A0ABU8BXC6_9RHOB
MIRWTDEAGQGSATDLGTAHAAVLRYDGKGKLIVPARRNIKEAATKPERAINAPGLMADAAVSEVLPAIRMVAARYQDDPALDAVDLSPAEWAAFFQAMIKVESNYTQGAVSHAGAIGLAQLMPGTARYLRVDPDHPIENLDGGARYLLEQLAAFGSLELALAAYNAGPEAVRRYNGIPPYRETRTHIGRVFAAYDRILADT